MKVKDILAQKGTHVYSISSDEPASDALQVLNEKHIGALLVLDDEQNIEGIISERDLLYMYARAKYRAQDLLVKDIMTPKGKLIVGHNNDDVEYVMSVMTKNKVRHIPIVSEEGKLTGIVSIGDIIKTILKDAEHEKKLLLDYIGYQ